MPKSFYFLSLHCNVYFVTGKNNHMAGMEGHIASPLQSEAQLNGHNIDRTNSSVLDDSPGFSNQNIGESGTSVCFIVQYMQISFFIGRNTILFLNFQPLVFLLYFVTFLPSAFCYEK